MMSSTLCRFRICGLPLNAPGDPEGSLGTFSAGVLVGPGKRLLAAAGSFYQKKREWRLAEQAHPDEHAEGGPDGGGVSQRNYAPVPGLTDKVLEVRQQPVHAGASLRDGRAKDLSKPGGGSLGALKKPGGVVTASVFLDGTEDTTDTRRTCLRDQDRVSIAANLKPLCRRKQDRARERSRSPRTSLRLTTRF